MVTHGYAMKPIAKATFLGLLFCGIISIIVFANVAKSSKPAPNERGRSETIDRREQDEIISFVVFTFAATEACKQYHPALGAQLDAALKSWRSRNKKHVDLALRDPSFDALKRDALASRPATPPADALCRDTIRSLGVSAETDIDVLRPRTSRASGNSQDSIGYSSVSAALEALKRDPTAKVREEAGWTVVSQKQEANLILWSFTPTAHPAYPAAVKRTLSEKDGAMQIQMSAVCEADTASCDKLIAEFRVLNNKMLDHIQQQKSAPLDEPNERVQR